MEPANRKSDLRVIKTKRAIHMAFAELLTEKDMDDSKNFGFCFLEGGKIRVRLFTEQVCGADCAGLPEDIALFIRTVRDAYSYLY